MEKYARTWAVYQTSLYQSYQLNPTQLNSIGLGMAPMLLCAQLLIHNKSKYGTNMCPVSSQIRWSWSCLCFQSNCRRHRLWSGALCSVQASQTQFCAILVIHRSFGRLLSLKSWWCTNVSVPATTTIDRPTDQNANRLFQLATYTVKTFISHWIPSSTRRQLQKKTDEQKRGVEWMSGKERRREIHKLEMENACAPY